MITARVLKDLRGLSMNDEALVCLDHRQMFFEIIQVHDYAIIFID